LVRVALAVVASFRPPVARLKAQGPSSMRANQNSLDKNKPTWPSKVTFDRLLKASKTFLE